MRKTLSLKVLRNLLSVLVMRLWRCKWAILQKITKVKILKSIKTLVRRLVKVSWHKCMPFITKCPSVISCYGRRWCQKIFANEVQKKDFIHPPTVQDTKQNITDSEYCKWFLWLKKWPNFEHNDKFCLTGFQPATTRVCIYIINLSAISQNLEHWKVSLYKLNETSNYFGKIIYVQLHSCIYCMY